jgi:hypothetical protein
MTGRPKGQGPTFRQTIRIIAFAIAFLIVCVGIRIVIAPLNGSDPCFGLKGPWSIDIQFAPSDRCQIAATEAS